MGTSVQPLPPIQDALAAIRAKAPPAAALPPIQDALAQIRSKGNQSTGNIDLRQASDDTRVAPTKAKASTPLVSAGLGESTVQGLLGGFADEIGGAGNATLNAILHPTTASANQWKGDYANYRDVARNLDQNYAQNHPVAHTLAELAGGALPAIVSGGALSGEEGAGMLARIGRGALGGAATGAVYGAGNAQGDITHRLAAAVPSVFAGGVLGGVAPLVTGGIAGLAQKVLGNGADNRAVGMLSQALQRDQVTPDVLAQRGADAAQSNAPMMAADLGGKNTAGVVRWATSQPSTFKDEMVTALEGRNAGQFDRIVQGANQATGNQYPNVTAARDALEATRSANAATNYPAAYAQGPYGGPVLDQAMQSPSFAKAIGIGQKLADQDDIVQSLKTGAAPGVTAVAASSSPVASQTSAIQSLLKLNVPAAKIAAQMGIPLADVQAAASSVPVAPNAVSIKALNFAKQYLDQGIARGFDANGGFDHTTATVTRDLLGQVLADAKGKVPELGNAIDTYASDSKPINALDLGQEALKMPPDELSQATQAMNSQERQGLVAGAMDALKNKGASVPDKSDFSAQFLANPAMRQRMQAIVPNQQGFDQLMNVRDQEMSMARTLKAAVGGSDTERNRILSGAMDAITPSDIAIAPISPHRTIIRMLGRAGQRYQAAQNTNTAEALSPYLQAEPGTESFSDLIQRLTDAPKRNALQTHVGLGLASWLGEGAGSRAEATRTAQ